MIAENTKIRGTFLNYVRLLMNPEIRGLADQNAENGEAQRLSNRIRELEAIKSRNGAQQAELDNSKKKLTDMAELDEYEWLLYQGQYSLFQNNRKEDRYAIRNAIRDYAVGVANHLGMNPDLPDTWNQLLRDHKVNQDQLVGDATFGGYLTNLFFDQMPIESPPAPGVPAHRLDAADVTVGPGAVAINGFAGYNALETTLNQQFNGLFNRTNYDKRAVERFLGDKDKDELKDISRDLMSNIQDRDKYRQEMKDKTIEIMQLADFHANEFNRYRRAKYFWDVMALHGRRVNTLVFMSALAGMAFVGGPAFFYILLGNIGISKTLLPYFDMRRSLSVNRRNIAREFARKIRAESNQIIEMFEKGMTLNDNMRKDLEDLSIEWNIMGESLQGKFQTDGWKPDKSFLIDNIVNSLLDGQSGLIPQALS